MIYSMQNQKMDHTVQLYVCIYMFICSTSSMGSNLQYDVSDTESTNLTYVCYEEDSSDSWGLDRIDQCDEVDHDDEGFHKFHYGSIDSGLGVQVYVMDSGITDEQEHEFGARVRHLYSFDGNFDDVGNGTQTAALIGSNTFGVARLAELISVKVIERQGTTSTAAVIGGINAIIADYELLDDPKKAVVHLSFYIPAEDPAMKDAISSLTDAGIPVVAPGGDMSGKDACQIFPANMSAPGVITVGAINEHDAVSSISNVGKCLNIFAPGELVTTMDSYGNTTFTTGTVFAAAHVTGAIARYLSAFDSYKSPSWIWDTISRLAANDKIHFSTTIEEQSPNKIVHVYCCDLNYYQSSECDDIVGGCDIYKINLVLLIVCGVVLQLVHTHLF